MDEQIREIFYSEDYESFYSIWMLDSKKSMIM